MADDQWLGRTHEEIVGKLNGLKPDTVFAVANTWGQVYQNASDAKDLHSRARERLAGEGFWTGAGPAAALKALTTRQNSMEDSENGTPVLAGKMGNALGQDSETLLEAQYVAQQYPVPPAGTDDDSKKTLLDTIRAEAQRMYTNPLSSADRPDMSDNADPTQPGSSPQSGNNGNGGGNNEGKNGSGSESNSGTETPSAATATGETSPQDLTSGDGSQGSGMGGGSGGGMPSSGAGGSGLPSSLGSHGGKDPSTGLPIGTTTAAGYSPTTSTGSGAGAGAGTLSPLRPGAGMPGGAVSGNSSSAINPSAMGAAGVRGMGMGGMGMMGAGARAAGHGDDEGDRATPDILINQDNTNDFIGPLPSASPAVIGNWDEQEDAAKRAEEKEIRRYKALGWDVKFQ